MKNILIKILPNNVQDILKKFKNKLLDGYAIKSYSQEGEDLILRRIFKNISSGFYIDIGAHHPKRFSNTYLFYKRGWRGINIDATPGSMKPFKKKRSRDINIECGINESQGTMEYYIFNEPALNSFSRQLSEIRHQNKKKHQIIETRLIAVRPLSTVLDEYLPHNQNIEFMTVDVEGLDLKVLKSNNWVKYRPAVVLAEILGSSLNEINQSNIARFMKQVDYSLYAKCVNTVFFRRNDYS